ncbi:MAG: alanine--tRNA ligase [Verrucomicrobia bacterium GWF2_51_19]|nr:MAG: alanine--tRNA ligase [Verrucomicrobia bacterium GWF2_51_19]HCJ11722.1 alanine--tRNA ligase [Opitutae bacterium]
MQSVDIRQSYLDFFKEKGHVIVPSSSLLPDAPNLLFTNSGMNQFVPYFLGERKAPYPSAADTQKCIRAGGKHNDLEDVGFDTYHQTFFEMLGNWSFGDYFKKEAIAWAWELLTKRWGFPKERLYATVYNPGNGEPSCFDQEAYDLWTAIFEKEGMDPNKHIHRFGRKDNFWMMGETGPCGPCSEIHIDLTPNGDTAGALVNQSSPYCIEIWNLVFIQFNAESNGTFIPLKEKHVDTGMGFERVAGILATTKHFKDFSQKPSNYNSDLFTFIFDAISRMTGTRYTRTLPEDRDNLSHAEYMDCAYRVIADHIRTLSFSIADGILPGNEGRNYVLRRILRRAILFGKKLNLPHGFFAKLVPPLVDKMCPFFPELREQEATIQTVIAREEQAFERTLDRGLALLDKMTAHTSVLSGADLFTLYDTYGFPVDLTQLIAKERKLSLDIEGFEREMDKQRERARLSQKKTAVKLAEAATSEKTVFVGYDSNNLGEVKATLLHVISKPEATYLIFDRTPFYGEMGGQTGDTGSVRIAGQEFMVIDTQRDEHEHFLHSISVGKEDIAALIGQEATLSVDIDRRRRIQRHHTATHLLHWALRKVLGKHVRQAGSLVTPDYLRFDFSHFEGLSPLQIREAEALCNAQILLNTLVTGEEMAFEKKPEHCIALFGEKYGSKVRVVDIGGYSTELCGGTHVTQTGDIGLIKVVQESAIASGTRRIEAVCGESALDLLTENFNQLHALSQVLSCHKDELEQRLQGLLQQNKDLQKRLRGFEQQNALSQLDDLVQHTKSVDGLFWIGGVVQVDKPEDLRGLALQISKKVPDSVVVLGATFEDKCNLVALCSEKAILKGYKAGIIIEKCCKKLDGKGGGKPDFAMGGAKKTQQLKHIIDESCNLVSG